MPSKRTPTIATLRNQANELATLSQVTTDWQQNADVFTRLCRRLTTTLSLEGQIDMLAEELGNLVPYDSFTYRHQVGTKEFVYTTGLGGQHKCDYRLTLEGTHYGDLVIHRRQRFADEELAAIEQLIGVAIFPIRNACLFSTVEQTALTDALTGIPNKRALNEALTRTCHLSDRHNEQYAVILCDLDHFKRINDNYGHVIGDHFLKAVARAIEVAVRSSDSIFRFGGEEFAILLPHTGAKEARHVADRIRHFIAKITINCGDTDVGTTMSAGVATHRKGESSDQWLTRADQALYSAKSAGRDCSRISDAIF